MFYHHFICSLNENARRTEVWRAGNAVTYWARDLPGPPLGVPIANGERVQHV